MNDKLYDFMDWAEIEAVVYSEEDHPKRILGPRVTEEGVLIQCFLPGEKKVYVKTLKDNQLYEMVQEDESGFFAVFLDRKRIPGYVYVVGEGEESREIFDPYAFPSMITEKEEKQFEAGICYDIYEKLGAHPMRIDGVEGVYFAVWAPNAIRVSVVGDFNHWDGRVYQMEKLDSSGIFQLFIPKLEAGVLYKYEIKAKGGLTYLKADPYANAAENRPGTASVVADLSYHWNDSDWMRKRKSVQGKSQPMYVYELHLGSWKVPGDREEQYFYNYRKLAPMLAEYVKEMGYTHIELMPVMEHPLDESWGYQVTGYYAPTARYGTPQDFMYFMDYMHQQEIGVILDWVPAHFPRDTFGLCSFDGTCLYEHLDPRQGSHPHWGTLIYNYGRPQVTNFLLANALFWAEKYHADGIRMDAVASMLYLDYGKNDGEWVANIYGGNENLEAIEFLKHLNSIFKKKYPDALLIAEESTAWPKITGDLNEEGLGFDYKWNMGWMHDFTEYMKLDPYFRKDNHHMMTFAMSYAYSEDYILVLSHDEVVHLKCSMINKMPGLGFDKYANLKAGYAFMMGHAGKKLLFMGQDFAQLREWSEERELDWYLLEEPEHQAIQSWMRDLLHMYKKKQALYELDQSWEGFEWVNADDAYRSIYSFIRHSKDGKHNLLFVINFTPMAREDYRVGVPRKKQYKLILNSDDVKYGGNGEKRQNIYHAVKKECDGRPYSFGYKLPPYGVAVFEF